MLGWKTKVAAALISCCVVPDVSRCAEIPEIALENIVGAADYSRGRVAPGELLVLYASGAGPEQLAEFQLAEDGTLATTLGKTRVLFDGIPAPMFYAVRGQLSASVPYEIAGRDAVNIVVEYEGNASLPVTLPVAESVPGIYTLDASGRGQAAMLNQAGCCNSLRSPARSGDIATLYATGAGQTIPDGISGNISAYDDVSELPVPALPLTVTVGGLPAEIIFAGETPLAVTGLLQVNFRVPRHTPIGDAVPLVLQIGEARSIKGVTMAIESASRTVMVIHEDPDLRRSLARMLADAGYEVVAAPRFGFPVHERTVFDLVIAGISALRKAGSEGLAGIPSGRRPLKVAAVLDVLDTASLREADLLGAHAIFTNSVDEDALLRRSRDLLRETPMPYSVQEIRVAGPRLR